MRSLSQYWIYILRRDVTLFLFLLIPASLFVAATLIKFDIAVQSDQLPPNVADRLVYRWLEIATSCY